MGLKVCAQLNPRELPSTTFLEPFSTLCLKVVVVFLFILENTVWSKLNNLFNICFCNLVDTGPN